MHNVHKFFNEHKSHCLAGLSLAVVIVHYIAPDFEVHITALVGIICAECA